MEQILCDRSLHNNKSLVKINSNKVYARSKSRLLVWGCGSICIVGVAYSNTASSDSTHTHH